MSKEQLMAIGISERDADIIIKQASTEVPKEKVLVSENKVEEKPLTISDITSIAKMSEYAKGQIVRLPDFAEGQPFIVRLKRPSMLVLAKSGKIPNSLLDTANSLFNEGKSSNDDSNKAMQDMYEVLCIIAESSLVEPTFKEIKEAGVELTDEQLIAIFNYSQQGIEGLKSFR